MVQESASHQLCVCVLGLCSCYNVKLDRKTTAYKCTYGARSQLKRWALYYFNSTKSFEYQQRGFW